MLSGLFTKGRLDHVCNRCYTQALDKEDILFLLNIPAASLEETILVERAAQMMRDLTCNKAKIAALIGIDDMVCPKDCSFCEYAPKRGNFASSDCIYATQGIAKSSTQLLLQSQLTNLFATLRDCHVDVSLLVASASTEIEALQDAIKLSREMLSADQETFVNYRDMTNQEVQRLVDSGASGFYHALRVCEGKITNHSQENRLATMNAISQCEGAKLISGIEPIWQNMNRSELDSLANVILQTSQYRTYHATAYNQLSLMKGSIDREPPLENWIMHVAATLVIARRHKLVPGQENYLFWVDMSRDPHDKSIKTSFDALKSNTLRTADNLRRKGWELNKNL